MRLNRKPVWFACTLLLALCIVSPLAAQPAAPGQQSSGAVCPLSDDQNRQATAAFEQLAQTFTNEPRCVNCHGGVHPFARDGTHPAEQVALVFRSMQTVVDGQTIRSTVLDEDATNDACQECHSELPGWKLAPASDTFVGRSAVQLCENQRNIFGRALHQGPPGFAGHIEHDVKGVPFIDTAFLGTRGLNDVGRALANDPAPQPPTDVTHAQLNALARQWADALGSKFQGDEDCGCVPHHYAILLEEKVEVDSQIDGDTEVIMRSRGELRVPINFKNDGTFTGSAEYNRTIEAQMLGSDFTCQGSNALDRIAWSVNGSVEGSDLDNPGTMHLTIKTQTQQMTVQLTCHAEGRTFTQTMVRPGGGGSVTLPDVPARVGQGTGKDIPVATLSGLSTVKVTIIQID